MQVKKIDPFQVETYIYLEKFEKIIDYINECNKEYQFFPGKKVVIVDDKEEKQTPP